MRFIMALLLGIVVGAAGMWMLMNDDAALAPRATEMASRVDDAASETAADLQTAMAARLEALQLTAREVTADLQRNGRVVRRRAREIVASAAAATTDARIVATIEAKLIADSELSARAISVSTSDGRVTLEGTVSSPELVGRAMLLALETDGVREVDSRLRVE